jgi:RNA polymerase sigma factor (sigma-70 family)
MEPMSDVTRILAQIDSGDPSAAEQLLPLVYDELRKLAAARLVHEKPGQTLQATALVHEAYLRLVGNQEPGTRNQEPADREPNLAPDSRPLAPGSFASRGHFFGAAAEAMRRILVDAARRKGRKKHGGEWVRSDADLNLVAAEETTDPLVVLAIHEALDRLAERSPRKAELVKLRYFVGCTIPEAAEILGIAAATAEEDWTYARAWLRREWLRGDVAPATATK